MQHTTRRIGMMGLCVILSLLAVTVSAQDERVILPDTGQTNCYSNDNAMTCPQSETAFYGQDAQYQRAAMAYQDNGDGTVTDLNTGLMWQQTPGAKMTWGQAMANAASFTLAGYTDWRLPTIKELYSLIDFNGMTGMTEATSIPYINTDYFTFSYGDTSAGERMIDAQYWSSTEYVSTTMDNQHTIFGVNFADGRIKGYGTKNSQMKQFVRYVRGATGYGVNDFVDHGDGTITDNFTGLMWMQVDSGTHGAGTRGDGSMIWQDALAWCEGLTYAGYTDWRLPDAKELQSIVDYSRSPDTTGSAAIDPRFSVTAITDPLGQTNYPYFWTSTTHLDGENPAARAAYIAFGEALGYMNGRWMDVHGAGAQRSDLKAGDPSAFALGLGPQGDEQVIYNYVRCVRGGAVTPAAGDRPETAPSETTPSAGVQNPQPPGNGAPGGQIQPGQQPPQEAIAACAGQNQGSACSFNAPQGAITGICASIQNQMACAPAGGPPG